MRFFPSSDKYDFIDLFDKKLKDLNLKRIYDFTIQIIIYLHVDTVQVEER